MVCDYEYDEDMQRMRIDCIGCIYGSSIEDFGTCMAKTIEKLMELKKVVRIVLAGNREYEYDFSESRMLLEIANAIERIVKTGYVSLKNVAIKGFEDESSGRYTFLQNLLNEIKYDPIEAYKKLLREIRHAKIKAEREIGREKENYRHYLVNALLPVQAALESCKIIQVAKPNLKEHKNRSLYRKIFHPTVRPNFIYTRYVSLPPPNSELLDRYNIGDTFVEIYNVPDKVRKIYHIIPPEFRLNEDEYTLLDTARRYIGRHEPREAELSEPERIRENIFRIGYDMLKELASSKGLVLSEKKLKNLANILTRYTAGLGIIDLFLQDENIQDIEINSPIGRTPIYIFHGIYQECETNIVPSREDADSWATRFRLQSGRPLDEANPVLDTELSVPGGRARVAAITRSLSPDGLGFALRRHRDKPWTFPLFIDNKMIDAFSAGLMWFLIDGSRTLLIAGTRSSGKSSFLGACMVQIMPKLRIITVEDSVTGDNKIVFERNGKIQRDMIGNLIDRMLDKYEPENDDGREILRRNPENIRVFSIRDGKVLLSGVSSFIRHKVKKDVYEIRTRTGRKIKVTGDHSLFTLGENDIEPVKVRELKSGSHIVTPRTLPFGNRHKDSVKLSDFIDKLGSGYIISSSLKDCIKTHKGVFIKLGSKSNLQHWRRTGTLPVRIYKEIVKHCTNLEIEKYKTSHNSRAVKNEIKLDADLLTFIGLWLADGCYGEKSVIISVVDEESRNVVRNIAERFGINVKMHSDSFSLMLNSSTLKKVMIDALGLYGDAYTKRIPEWVFNLSDGQVSYLLKGIYSGDGYLTEHEIGISLCSYDMIKDLQTLLLRFGIISRINKQNKRDKTYSLRVSSLKSIRPFHEKIGFLQNKRINDLNVICKKISTHDATDIIPLTLVKKEMLSKRINNFNRQDYITRNNNIGRQMLSSLAINLDDGFIDMLINSDIFWDQIDEIKKIDYEGFVYDLSVPESENFVCENILAHNTLELPCEQLRNLGYNIERLKSRSVITHIETELAAEEALRTALRLGDSCLIVGEVRSREALALYEAMRIGALANVVAGTIHGDSAYGVFDRVVNDLGVPPTSFKATDVILICNMLKSPDGLRSFRRVVELTEVRKHWKTDPMDEGGFVDLLEYSAKDDMLKPTKTLLTGESLVLNSIAERVREWKGEWDAVWENIKLREKIFRTLIEYAYKANNFDILESPIVMQSNAKFHIISNEVKEEYGKLDNSMIFEKWHDWIKGIIKKG